MKNGSEKKAGVAILMLDKIELKTKTVKTERRIFRSIRRYNNCKYVCIQQLSFKKKQKQTKIKGEIEKSTIEVRDLKHFSLRN